MSVYDVASAEDVAALRAEVARQGEAIRRLVAMLDDPNGYHDAELAHVPAALDAPVPDAGSLTPAEAKSQAWTLLAAHGFNVSDNAEGRGLIAWRRDDDAPTPASPADTPLSGPVAFADRYGGLPVEVADAIRAILQARAVGGLGYADASNTADALAAFWRAQQQPALGDDVREAMREASEVLRANARDYNKRGYTEAATECENAAARLRAMAGEP